MKQLQKAFKFLKDGTSRPMIPLLVAEKFFSDIQWEWRCFWSPADQSIPVYLKSFEEQGTVDLKKKQRTDIYLWEGDNPRNIKLRHKTILYKPLIETYENMTAFGRKQKFNLPALSSKMRNLYPRLDSSQGRFLSLNHLHQELQNQQYDVKIIPLAKKIYQKQLSATLSFEISFFTYQREIWKTVCIEGSSFNQVKETSALLVPQPGHVMSYTEFFKRNQRER